MLASDPDWTAEVQEWATRFVTLTGPVEVFRERDWSCVLRVPTTGGTRWFKATIPSLRHEAALVALLQAVSPRLAPVLVASDVDRGWMLMDDAGIPLDDVVARDHSLDRWLDVLPRYARLQRATEHHVDRMLALGVPDLRLAVLPARFAALVGAIGSGDRRLSRAIPVVEEMCDELGAFGIAETLQHDDLHGGQVHVDGDGYRIIDWGDAVIAHPFFTLAVTLEGVLQWGLDDVEGSVDTTPFRDAYLGGFGDERDLTRAVELALRLGWAARAVATQAAGGEEQSRILTRLRMFLDGRP